MPDLNQEKEKKKKKKSKRCENCGFRRRGPRHEDGPHHNGEAMPSNTPRIKAFKEDMKILKEKQMQGK